MRLARLLAAQLDHQLGVRILIENRAGAGGTAGASLASWAAPDGYTFFMSARRTTPLRRRYIPSSTTTSKRTFVPVGLIAQPPQVVVVNPNARQAIPLRS